MSKDTPCCIPGCSGNGITRNMCPKHYQRWRHNGDPMVTKSGVPRKPGEGGYTKLGYLIKESGGKRTYEHVAKAEKAIGKSLPIGAHVHHVDCDPGNNTNTNLVICPDAEYHHLLHIRTRAMDACGNPDWRQCRLCKQYDDVAGMYVSPRSDHVHRKCRLEYKARYRLERRAAGLAYY